MKVFEFNRAIVRRPSETVVNGLRVGDHEGPTYAGIVIEHAAYVAALERAGLDVTILPPLPDYPDSIFVEDPALVFPEGAILLRPGAASREAEAAELAPTLHAQFDTVLTLAEGFADGGDVLVTPTRTFVGLSERTDRAGAAALLDRLATLGRQGAVVQPPAGTLHLKTAASLLDDETILATRAVAATGLFDGFRVVTVPEGEEGGANVLRLNDRVLAGSRYPLTLELLDRLGFAPVALDVDEIGKIDAGLTCMSLRWHSGG